MAKHRRKLAESEYALTLPGLLRGMAREHVLATPTSLALCHLAADTNQAIKDCEKTVCRMMHDHAAADVVFGVMDVESGLIELRGQIIDLLFGSDRFKNPDTCLQREPDRG